MSQELANKLHSMKLRLTEMIAQQTAGTSRDDLFRKYRESQSCHWEMLEHDLLWYLCNTLVSEKYAIKDGDKYFWTGREF